MKEQTGRKKKFLFVLCIFFIYAFFIGHVDCNTISTWGFDLLESIRLGKVSSFPVYTYDVHRMATNYSLFVNAITALWLLPFYVLLHLFKVNEFVMAYDLWFKCLILLLTVLSVRLFEKILQKADYQMDAMEEGKYFFEVSAVLLIAVLGKGQVDMISLFFLLLGIHSLLNGKYGFMAVFFGLSICIKPFAILLIIPILILLISKLEWKIFAYGLIMMLPYGLDYCITRITMPQYGAMKAITSAQFKEAFGMSRVEQLFAAGINDVLIYWGIVLVLCFVSLKLAMSKQVKRVHYLLFPSIIYILFGIFVSTTCYWFVLVLPWLIAMGLELSERNDFCLAYTISNMGVFLYTIMIEKTNMPGPKFSLLQVLGLTQTQEVTLVPFTEYQVYGYKIGATLFVVGMIIIWAQYFMEWKKGELTKDSLTIKSKHPQWYTLLCNVLVPMPVILYVVVSYVVEMVL